MGEELNCTDCGATFTVDDGVLERYPGWQPSRCRRCHGRRSKGGGAQRRSNTAGTRGGARSGGGAQPRLSPAEVLERYTAGPDDGVFTDGSADPNPGPGGWGAVYVAGGQIIDEACGREPETTNNRMELRALIAGIDLVPEGTSTTAYSDSRLVVDTATKWAPGWARNGWRRKTGPVQNLDLVKALYERVSARPEIEIAWIKAHAGSRWNEYADALASGGRPEAP